MRFFKFKLTKTQVVVNIFYVENTDNDLSFSTMAILGFSIYSIKIGYIRYYSWNSMPIIILTFFSNCANYETEIG